MANASRAVTARSLARTLTHSRLRQEEVEEEEEEEEELPICVSRHTFASHSCKELQGLLPLLACTTNTDGSTVRDSVSLHTFTPYSLEKPQSLMNMHAYHTSTDGSTVSDSVLLYTFAQHSSKSSEACCHCLPFSQHCKWLCFSATVPVHYFEEP